VDLQRNQRTHSAVAENAKRVSAGTAEYPARPPYHNQRAIRVLLQAAPARPRPQLTSFLGNEVRKFLGVIPASRALARARTGRDSRPAPDNHISPGRPRAAVLLHHHHLRHAARRDHRRAAHRKHFSHGRRHGGFLPQTGGGAARRSHWRRVSQSSSARLSGQVDRWQTATPELRCDRPVTCPAPNTLE